MFRKKQFMQLTILAAALMMVALWPLSQAMADDYSNPPSKDNSMTNQTKASSNNPKATTSTKTMTHKGALDGKTFAGKMTDSSDKTKMYDETITFHNGMFHSSACDAYGFSEASYSVKKEKDMTTFTSETKSNKDGHMSELKWHGTIKGDILDATADMVMDGKPAGTSTVKAMMETQSATNMK